MTQLRYGERVQCYSDDGTLLGSADFTGQVRKNPLGGLWSWRGTLTGLDFDAFSLVGAGVRLEFPDGATGQALLTNFTPSNRGGRVDVRGNGMPPRTVVG